MLPTLALFIWIAGDLVAAFLWFVMLSILFTAIAVEVIGIVSRKARNIWRKHFSKPQK